MLSPLVFSRISTHFTVTHGIPSASTILKLMSFHCLSKVKPWYLTEDFISHLQMLYAQSFRIMLVTSVFDFSFVFLQSQTIPFFHRNEKFFRNFTFISIRNSRKYSKFAINYQRFSLNITIKLEIVLEQFQSLRGKIFF